MYSNLTDVLFDVDKIPVFCEKMDNGNIVYNSYRNITDKKAIIRKDNGKVLSIVSNKYVPVSNKVIHEKFSHILDDADLKFVVEKAIMDMNGGRTAIVYSFPKLQFEAKKGDIVGIEAYLVNDFTSKKSISLDFGFQRLICTNGAVAFGNLHRLTLRHFEGATEKMTEYFSEVIMKNYDMIRQFTDSLVKNEFKYEKDVLDFIKELGLTPRNLDKIANTWYNEYQSARDFWSVYNACTFVLTHEMGVMNGYAKYMILKRVSKKFSELLSEEKAA